MDYVTEKELNIYEKKKFAFEIKNYHLAALKLVPDKGDILEMGIGDGRFLSLLKNDDRTLFGLDIIDQNIINARKKGIKSVAKCDLNADLPFKNESFDTVIALEVIEHIYEYEKLISEISRIMKKDAKAIISVPNCTYWRYQAHMILKQEVPDALIGKEGHVVRYSLKQWRSIFENYFKTKTYATEKIVRFIPLPHNILTRYAFFLCEKK